MAKPEQSSSTQKQQSPRVPGRYVGLECTGRELYQAVLLETLDGQIVRREVLEGGTGTRDGRGVSLPVAMGAVNRAMARRITETGQLWRP